MDNSTRRTSTRTTRTRGTSGTSGTAQMRAVPPSTPAPTPDLPDLTDPTGPGRYVVMDDEPVTVGEVQQVLTGLRDQLRTETKGVHDDVTKQLNQLLETVKRQTARPRPALPRWMRWAVAGVAIMTVVNTIMIVANIAATKAAMSGLGENIAAIAGKFKGGVELTQVSYNPVNIGALGWILNPWLLLVVTVIVIVMMYRRSNKRAEEMREQLEALKPTD